MTLPKPAPSIILIHTFFIQDIADFVEGAEHGLIYMNFGSLIKSEHMPPEYKVTM